MAELLLNSLINGILLGGVLALLAFGMNLIFGVVKILHMAYGQCVMLGLYVIYTLVVPLGFPLLLACLITLPVMGFVGFLPANVRHQPAAQGEGQPPHPTPGPRRPDHCLREHGPGDLGRRPAGASTFNFR